MRLAELWERDALRLSDVDMELVQAARDCAMRMTRCLKGVDDLAKSEESPTPTQAARKSTAKHKLKSIAKGKPKSTAKRKPKRTAKGKRKNSAKK
jgi:hypothetical protein